MKKFITSLQLFKRLFCTFCGLGLVLVFSTSQAFAADTTVLCESTVARLVSVEGEVLRQVAGDSTWRPVLVESLFCAGDSIQVAENSRAVLQVSDHTLVNLDAESILSFSKIEKDVGVWVSLLKGISHFLSRVPRQLNVETPLLNALVEGTEFVIRVEENETFMTVFEGTVFAQNELGELRLESGQSGKVQSTQAPVQIQVVRPRDAVHWALHYPSILQFDEINLGGAAPGTWQSHMSTSIKHYKTGNFKEAFGALSSISGAALDPSFFIYRAALRLTVGQIAGAERDLAKVLQEAPDNGDVLALKAIIAVVQNDRESALVFANRSVEAAPTSAGPYLSRSYVFQSVFRLNEALKDLETAVNYKPENALAWARLAELRLMFRDLEGALRAAQRAVCIDPRIAKTKTVLGFAHLIRSETDQAKVSFEKSIELDPGAPMSRLGLGLAKIRKGELRSGRQEIETAAMLDPGHSLIRSYLGKAYYEEKRDNLAVEQYKMARELDPGDPTPDLYSAILNQTNNQPVRALKDIERSITLNENRAVYRSRLLLDEDLASRSVSLGRIYQDLGFEQRALVEGWESVTLDPGNYSAHRLLADSYASQPRHEIARVSELLQSQLLQPLNMTALRPQLGEANLTIFPGAGPSDPSFNEFSPLFVRNNIGFQFNGVAGSNNTLGNDLVLSTLHDKTSLSVGQFHYETDGYRENNSLKQDIYNLFGQMAVSSRSNVQVELKRNERDSGDLRQQFYLDTFSTNRRETRDEDTLRMGYHYSPSAGSDFIFSGIYRDTEFERTDLETVSPLGPAGPILKEEDLKQNIEGYNAEGQYQGIGPWHAMVVVGGGYLNNDDKADLFAQVTSGPVSLGSPLKKKSTETIEHKNAYAYVTLRAKARLLLTVGTGVDDLSAGAIDKRQVNPKLGIIWRPVKDTTFRLAGFRTLKRLLVANQTIEPTQVAGFNQFFDDSTGTDAKNYGLAIDQQFGSDLSMGLALFFRDMEVPFVSNGGVRLENQEEQSYRTHLQWAPHHFISIRAEYQLEKFNRERSRTSVGFPAELTTQIVPVTVHIFFKGFFLKLKTRYFNQEIVISQAGAGNFSDDDDQFWITDAQLGYRLPRRFGIVSFSVQNLFNESFNFYEDDFRSGLVNAPTVVPERTFYLKLLISFQ